MLSVRGVTLTAVRDEQGLIEVIEDSECRSLYFGNRARQSSMLLHDPIALPLAYTRCMLAALLFRPRPERILLIGLGGGSQARFFLHHFPDCRLDCVESRASVADLATRYFALPDTPHLKIHIGDGADYVRRCPAQTYDLILTDAFDSDGINSSVCECSFYSDCRTLLKPGGVLAVNLWTTSGTAYKDILKNIETGFDGQLLRLPVERHANLIAFGLDRAHSLTELKSMSRRAKKLGQSLGLELHKYLRRLLHHNGSGIRRWLDLNCTTRR